MSNFLLLSLSRYVRDQRVRQIFFNPAENLWLQATHCMAVPP